MNVDSFISGYSRERSEFTSEVESAAELGFEPRVSNSKGWRVTVTPLRIFAILSKTDSLV